jgi:hypothetical protein
MEKWFNDDEVNDLLTQLLDRLCTLERIGGEAYSSTLMFWAQDKTYPILFAKEGKPFFPQEHLTYLDLEMAVKFEIKNRLPN